jgi:hypothetical protein
MPGVKPPSTFLAPVMEPTDLPREIIAMMGCGESGELQLPLYAEFVLSLKK